MDKTKPQKQPPDTNRPVLVLTPGGRIIVGMHDDGEWLMENAWGQDADWMEMVVDPVDWTEMPSWDRLLACTDPDRWCLVSPEKMRILDGYNEERAEWAAKVAALETLAVKVDAIRNSIVGMQGFNFSEHAYPLVAALEEAGYRGQEYKIVSENLGTLIEQRNRADKERDEARANLAAARAEYDDVGLAARVESLEKLVARLALVTAAGFNRDDFSGLNAIIEETAHE